MKNQKPQSLFGNSGPIRITLSKPRAFGMRQYRERAVPEGRWKTSTKTRSSNHREKKNSFLRRWTATENDVEYKNRSDTSRERERESEKNQ